MANLLGLIRGYHGQCDRCGEEINEPLLLVSDTLATDEYSNRLFILIGIPDEENAVIGKYLFCKKCGFKPIILRLYEPTNVTDSIKQAVNDAF